MKNVLNSSNQNSKYSSSKTIILNSLFNLRSFKILQKCIFKINFHIHKISDKISKLQSKIVTNNPESNIQQFGHC